MNLTEEQQVILANCNKNIFISAAPGSGKSTILSEICKLLLKQDDKCQVMLITFTNAAARSIVSKCNTLDQSRIIGGTFHSIAYRNLRAAGCKANICDEHKKRLIIKSLFKCRKDKEKFEKLYDEISTAKSVYPQKNSSVVDAYCKELEKYNLIDFDDIIAKFIDLPSRNSDTTIHILVDELQDTSGPQFQMLNKLSAANNGTLIGVADDDQCIYEWRGARPRNVADFISSHVCTTFNMGTNFRSTATIVRHSTNVIKHNKERIPKTIRSYTTRESSIIAYPCINPFDEIDYVVMKCLQNKGSKIAILYRNRTFKYHLEFKLRKAGLKYKVNDFLDITDRSSVRIMIACLKIAADNYDYFDLEQAAKALKGIGSRTISKLKDDCSKSQLKEVILKWSQDTKLKTKLNSVFNLQKSFKDCAHLSLDNLVRRAEKEFVLSYDYQDQMRDLLLDITRPYDTSAEDIVELSNELGLDSKDDPYDENATIELSTIHGFKGLEDEVVIVPFTQMFLDVAPGRVIDEEAERRLFYVGITRAKEKLYLTYSGPMPKFIKEMKL